MFYRPTEKKIIQKFKKYDKQYNLKKVYILTGSGVIKKIAFVLSRKTSGKIFVAIFDIHALTDKKSVGTYWFFNKTLKISVKPNVSNVGAKARVLWHLEQDKVLIEELDVIRFVAEFAIKQREENE